MIFITRKSINQLTIFCCNMFHDHEKFLQQKDLNTTFAFFNSLRIKNSNTKNLRLKNSNTKNYFMR